MSSFRRTSFRRSFTTLPCGQLLGVRRGQWRSYSPWFIHRLSARRATRLLLQTEAKIWPEINSQLWLGRKRVARIRHVIEIVAFFARVLPWHSRFRTKSGPSVFACCAQRLKVEALVKIRPAPFQGLFPPSTNASTCPQHPATWVFPHVSLQPPQI